jgi:hypothetical protein
MAGLGCVAVLTPGAEWPWSAGMQLINALTNTRNLGVDTRMHIRNEMMAAGLRKLLPALKNSIDPRLRLHISLWEKNSKWDIQEIRARCVAVNAAGRTC